MIKLLAIIFMLIDHIGMVFFPEAVAFRLLGRFSMPLFAWAVARGFYCMEARGTIRAYEKRLLLFAVVSQIPYQMMLGYVGADFSLNIGFTWLFGVILLDVLTRKTNVGVVIAIVMVGTILFAVPVDYSLYGICFPLVFYATAFKTHKPLMGFGGIASLYICYIMFLGGTAIQIFALFAVPLVFFIEKYDKKIMLPKWFFYWFYPVHICLLMGIVYLI